MATFADPTEATAPISRTSGTTSGTCSSSSPRPSRRASRRPKGPVNVMHAAVGVYSVEKNEITGLGAQIIFWVKVIEQLRDSLEHGTIVIARLVREGKAYTLDAVDSTTRAKVEKAYSWD